MKTYKSFAIAMLMIASATARPQDAGTMKRNGDTDSGRHPRVTIQVITKNYLNCLDSDIPSIVESALGHVTYMRIAFQERDLRNIQEKLAELTVRGMTRTVRYKAFTALEVYGNPAAFQRYIEHRHANGDGLLDEIGTRLLPQTDLVVR